MVAAMAGASRQRLAQSPEPRVGLSHGVEVVGPPIDDVWPRRERLGLAPDEAGPPNVTDWNVQRW